MNAIFIDNKKKSIVNLMRQYPGARIVDVTSNSAEEFVRFSPFYPHGGIPIPYSEPRTSKSVEGIWQGLKVFEHTGVSMACFMNDTMKDMKRTARKHGLPLGHRKGVEGTELLGYIEARKLIYLPSYLWVLENRLRTEVGRLRTLHAKQDLVLLDYETNGDVENASKPLSHASLVRAYLLGTYPVQQP